MGGTFGIRAVGYAEDLELRLTSTQKRKQWLFVQRVNESVAAQNGVESTPLAWLVSNGNTRFVVRWSAAAIHALWYAGQPG